MNLFAGTPAHPPKKPVAGSPLSTPSHIPRALSLCLTLSLLGCGVAPESPPEDAGARRVLDTDGDSISDIEEGAAESVDTDGDGIPDFQDTDSDGDGIDDQTEAGDEDPSTPARDADGDGIPDFRDLDADGNGIQDRDEGAADTDGDGVPDFADLDDDGDRLDDLTELAGTPETPPDADADGIPDFRDTDSDDDTILDSHEGNQDTDGDGLLDRFDDDSDGDGISDAAEAGDADLMTPPVDTDGDTIADYRDPDSDDDGLTDDFEVGLGTDPRSADSDEDGVTDLIEHAAGTDPTDASEDPRSRGDFVFVVPYEEAPTPTRDTLSFRTSIRRADIYFSFDTSTTMIQEMNALRSPTRGVPAIISELLCTETMTACADDTACGAGEICGPRGMCSEDPAIDGCLLDLYTGVGEWDHIDTYRNLVSLQSNPMTTAAAIPTAPNWWVAPTQPAACVADPANCRNTRTIGCDASGVGCPAYRSDAVRIYVHISDANDECRCGAGTNFPCVLTVGDAARCGIFTPEFAGGELQRQGIRFIGLIGTGAAHGEGTATGLARALGVASGTVDMAGEPFVYPANDALVVSRTVEAVRAIVTSSAFDITIEATDEMDDAGDALQFIDHLEVNTTGDGCLSMGTTRDTDADTFDDAFDGVLPGSRVCWDVIARQNDTIMPTREPQVFRARLTVYADESEVDARTVYFLVPADVDLPLII